MLPRKFGNHVTARPSTRPSACPSTPQGNQCEMSFCNKCGSLQPEFNLILNFYIKLNWQLSKQSIRWPVSHDPIKVQMSTHLVHVFFEVFRWPVIRCKLTAGSSLILFFRRDVPNSPSYYRGNILTGASPLALANKSIYYFNKVNTWFDKVLVRKCCG